MKKSHNERFDTFFVAMNKLIDMEQQIDMVYPDIAKELKDERKRIEEIMNKAWERDKE